MRIQNGPVAFTTAHRQVESLRTKTSVRAWIGAAPAAAVRTSPSSFPPAPTYRPPPARDSGSSPAPPQEVNEDTRTLLTRLLIEALTGKKIRLLDPHDLTSEKPAEASASQERAPDGPPAARGWGVDLRTTEVRQEAEETTVAAAGAVTTADGRELAVSVELRMAREYRAETQTQVQLGDAARAQDPLVVNFGAGGASLEPLRFTFDLDADGESEQVPLLAPGSGLLALDRNGNGTIDDGIELFGPRSGDGYADLAALDGDRNGWIDEGDAVFGELRVWIHEPDGRESLLSLGELSIGALSLAHAESPFALKSTGNDLQGQVRATGIYLREDGSAGTTQQVDLVV
ncbi:MAG: VCBS repeat-containing protein [Deltaproteobacteria bacterium]|nr:VCBS repeat-containing protein [Deltaproteobacteria bacterium]